MNRRDLRAEVLEVARELSRSGLVKLTSGNVSAIDRESGVVAITPSGIPYKSMTVEDICIVDLEGNIVGGSNRPSSEMPMHLIFYKHLEEVQAIVHTHSPFATALSVVRRSIPVICSASLSLGGEVPVSNFALPGTREIGDAALKAIREGGGKAVLLQNHGVLAIGRSLHEAFANAVRVEEAAEIFYRSLQLGTPTIIPPEKVQEALDRKKLGTRLAS